MPNSNDWTALYAIDTRTVADGRTDVRVRNVGGDDYDAIRTFDTDVALYGIDGGAELADWLSAVVRDFYCQSNGAAATDDSTRWIDQSESD